ncbi:MAG: galactose oxidase early set domain-containing protein [Vicinamibacterales bacterium]
MLLAATVSSRARPRATALVHHLRSAFLRTFALALLVVGVYAQAGTIGSWATFDWQCDSVSLESVNGPRERVVHGALIPHGPYRGCVLTWGKYANKTETFLWDPSNPQRFIRVVNTWAGGVRDVEGIGMTWDDEGQLVIVGPSATPGVSSAETWRVFPSSLNYPPSQTAPGVPCNQSSAQIGGNAWRANQLMSVARFRASILGLARGLQSATTFDRSALVLGGMTSSTVNDGWEFWQALSPRSASGGSAWGATFVPDIGHPHPNPVLSQQYVVQGGLTETQVEATPCAVQMATSGQPGFQFIKSPLVAQDSLVAYSTPPVASNSPGRSTVIRPQYATIPGVWELWPTPLFSVDRTQGAVVLRHDKDSAVGTYSGKNRLISIGGLYYQGVGTPLGWRTQVGVHEYKVATLENPAQGHFEFINIQPAAPLEIGRIDNSAIVLPTGDILVVGGGRMLSGTSLTSATPSNLPVTPVRAPQLVRPGRAGQSAASWSVATMEDAPNQPAYSGWAPRGYGHAAVLLPDGRVLVTGGDTSSTGSVGLSFTGDVFSPPYLFQGFRPTIASIQGSSFMFGDEMNIAVARQPEETIDSVVLLRPASTTFGFDSSQRYIELNFTLGAFDPAMGTQSVVALAPADDLGPPGYYMLFVMSRIGGPTQPRVPSVAQFIYLN